VFVIRHKKTGEYWNDGKWTEHKEDASQYDEIGNLTPLDGAWIERPKVTRTFHVSWTRYQQCSVTVEADNEEEAYEEAVRQNERGNEDVEYSHDDDSSDWKCEEI
jgi:hypothetical protein